MHPGSGELRSDQRRPLIDHGGRFAEKAGQRILELLYQHQSDLGDTVNRMLTPPASSDLRQQTRRDATADGLALTGAKDELEEIDVAPTEGDLIARDAATFLGWASEFTDTVKVRRFTDPPGRQLKVMVSDRDWLETQLGPDLVYYHEQRASFVLVQYKRMAKGGQDMAYRADAQFERQTTPPPETAS